MFGNVISVLGFTSESPTHHKSSIIQKKKKSNKNRKICKITAIKKELDIQLFFLLLIFSSFCSIFSRTQHEELWHTLSWSARSDSWLQGYILFLPVVLMVTEWINIETMEAQWNSQEQQNKIIKKKQNQTQNPDHIKRKCYKKFVGFPTFVHMIYFSDINFRCED